MQGVAGRVVSPVTQAIAAKSTNHTQRRGLQPQGLQPRRSWTVLATHRVDISVDGNTTVLDVEEGQSILEAALEQGLELSHDCE